MSNMLSFVPRHSTRESIHIDLIKKPDKKIKTILEPQVSDTSVNFIRDDEQDEKDPEKVYETPYPEGKFAQSMKRYAVIRAIQTLIYGDTSSTATKLSLLDDSDLDNKRLQEDIIKCGGTDLLVNILETKEFKCHIGALRIIEKMSTNNKIRLLFANLGIVPSILSIMKRGFTDVKISGARTLTQLCHVQKLARYIRKSGGIPLLVNCLDIPTSLLYTRYELLTAEQKEIITLATAAASTLKQMSTYHKTTQCLYKDGVLVVMKKVANSCHKDLLIEFFGLLATCSKNHFFRKTIEVEGIIVQLIQGLADENQDLRCACASTIATCAADSEVTRHMVRLLKGLDDVVDLTKDLQQNDATLVAVTRAASKLAQDSRNLKIMSDKGLARNLVKFVRIGMNDEIISNVMEGLAECGRLLENAQLVVNTGVLVSIIQHLMGSNPSVLIAAAQCLGAFARHEDVAQTIMQFEGMRLLFSILRHSDPSVVSTSLWALKPLIQNSVDSAEEIRCLIGGLDLLIGLLQFPDLAVKANACGLIAEVAKDPENLQIMSDTGVVPALAECALEKNETLQISTAEAIANVSSIAVNAKDFGLLGAPVVIRRYLLSPNPELHLKAMQALANLTKVPHNCLLLNECGGVRPIVADLMSPCNELQALSTDVLRNMRHMAQMADNKLIDICSTQFYSKVGRTKKPRVESKVAEQIETKFFREAIKKLKASRHPELQASTQNPQIRSKKKK